MNALLRTVAAGSLTVFAGLAAAAPVVSQVGNMLANGNFESGSASPISTGPGVGAASALGSWNQYSNSNGITSTWATGPLIEGTHLARLSGGLNDGLYQYMGLGGGTYTLSGWFYVISGAARLGMAWNGGSNASFGATTTKIGVWEYLAMTTNAIPASTGGALLYGNQPGSDFLVEGAWLNAGAVSTSNFDPARGFAPPSSAVPEPGTLALAALGLAAAVGTRRAGRRNA